MNDTVTSSLDVAHLRTWIDREDVGTEVLTEDLARKYHATFNFAGDAPKQGEIAPRLIHFCLTQAAVPTDRLGPDGHPQRGGFLPPVPLPRRMWAAGRVTFGGDLKVGDATRRVSRIADVVLKEGRTGQLCFVAVQHRFEVNGQVMLEERQDIVYRGFDAQSSATQAPRPAELGTDRRPMKVAPPLLFRYSALTFNSHRIHYDRRYATQAEGYPGLVVHAPLQAALLCNYATELHGAPPKHFSFRGLSPLFDDDTFALHATQVGDGLKLWTAKENGPVCMSAEATWE